VPEFANREELEAFLAKMEEEMREAAKKFEFERAAKMRDLIRELRSRELFT
jgi:excinuclease ABC subunit B